MSRVVSSVWMSCVVCMNESCHDSFIRKTRLFHTRLECDVICRVESHSYTRRDSCKGLECCVTCMHESRHEYMNEMRHDSFIHTTRHETQHSSRVWKSRVMCMNASGRKYEWVMSHVWTRCDWFIRMRLIHTWMSVITCMNESHHTTNETNSHSDSHQRHWFIRMRLIHTWMSVITCINESHHTRMRLIRTLIHTNDCVSYEWDWFTHEWVPLHVRMSRRAVRESHHTTNETNSQTDSHKRLRFIQIRLIHTWMSPITVCEWVKSRFWRGHVTHIT